MRQKFRRVQPRAAALGLFSLCLLIASVAGAQLRFTLRDPIALGVGAESGPRSMVLADVDKDGRPDIVALDNEHDGVAVLLNDGSAMFGEPRRFSNTDFFDMPTALAVADVGSRFSSDNVGRPDGNVDIIVADASGGLTILYGTGSGDFQFPDDPDEVQDVGLDIVSIALGNFDGHGDNDDVACLDSDGEVFFECSAGDGVYGPCSTESLDVADTDDNAGDPVDVATGDFDGNGSIDVAALYSDDSGGSGSPDNVVFLALGDGLGNFTAGRTAAADVGARSLVRGRLDSDTIDDLVVAESQGNTLGDNMTILRGSSNAVFRRSKSSLDVFATGVALGNIDNDANGCLDAIGISSESSTAAFAIGNCDGTFGDQLATGPAIGTARAVEAADLNGDGLLDFAVVLENGDRIRVAVNRGAGPTDTPSTPANTSPTPTPTPTAVGTPQLEGCRVQITSPSGSVELVASAQGDFDGDGVPDIAVVDRSGGQVVVLLTDIDRLKGPDAPCDFPRTDSYSVGTRPMSIAAKDLNDDSRIDLAVTTSAGVSILLASGSKGHFMMLPIIPTGSDPRSVAIAHFDDDGVMDLAVANHGSNSVQGSVQILFGNGDNPPTFAERSERPAFTVPGALIVVAADLNGDGFDDLGVASDADNTVRVFLQDPNSLGLFPGTQPNATSLNSQIPTAMIAAQTTTSPALQLVVTTRAANGEGSFVVLNRSTTPQAGTQFRPGTPVATGGRPSAIGMGEFVAGTGHTDVLVASSVEDSVSFFPGNSDGTFGASVSTSAASRAPSSLVTGDFDMDGKDDVAITNMGNGSVTLLLSSRVPPTPIPTITNTAAPTNSPTMTGTPGPSRTPTVGTPGPTATFKPGSFQLSSCSIAPEPAATANDKAFFLIGGAAILWWRRRRLQKQQE